jgi:hypothetical protein
MADETDIRTLFTVSTGPGNTYPQATPASSIGGYASHTPWTGGTLHDLFGPLTNAEFINGTVDYRCVYVVNNHETDAIASLKAYLESSTLGGCDFAIGVDPTAVSLLGQDDSQAVRTASTTTAPAGVVFSAPTTYAAGVSIGDLIAGAGRALWIRRTPDTASAAPATDAVTLVLEFPDV